MGIGLRAAYVHYLVAPKAPAGPISVQESSALIQGESNQKDTWTLIENVRKSLRFSSQPPFAVEDELTAHIAPGYPYLVGLLGRSVPEESLGELVRWGQVVIGGITPGFFFLFCRRAFHSLIVATLAGLFTAFHPFWIVEVANFTDATLVSFVLGLSLFLAVRAGDTGGPLTCLALGGVLGGLPLLRAALLPLSFILLIWFLLRSRWLKQGWLYALCAFLGFVATLAPWTIRNYQVFGEPLPIVTSAYLHLWIGNNPEATGGPATDAMWKLAESNELLPQQSQPRRYSGFSRLVYDEISSNPEAFFQRRLNSSLMFLLGQKGLQQGTFFEMDKDNSMLPESLSVYLGLIFKAFLVAMLFLSFIGWRWSYGWKLGCVPAALVVFWLPIPYILGHAGLLSGPRLPLDGVLLSFSAFAVGCIFPGLGGRLLSGSESTSSFTYPEDPTINQPQRYS
ncbi:MAG: glycosyltransferase family 39 protein [Gemmataceae bacterium]